MPVERRNSAEARARFNDVLNTLVTSVGQHLVHFHISDVAAAEWVDHKNIGTGIVDFPRLFATVRSTGCRRLYVLELEEPNQLAAIAASRTYVQPLITR